MEVRQCVKFTGVEVTAPVDKDVTGPVKKAMTDLARAVAASVEVIRALEKATTDGRRDGDGGRLKAQV
jgi:hypothetical protein